MLLAKRIICGIVALLLVIFGIWLISSVSIISQGIGFCFFVGGITLAYIAIMQRIPNYNFWITLVALGLAYALYSAHFSDNDSNIEEKTEEISQVEKEVQQTKELMGQKEVKQKPKPKRKKKKKPVIDLSSYPRISGSATVLTANIFYVGGRYIRLYGIDAPDTDQMCSDASGSSYNCGEEAASWVRSWIDNNVIDCYLLKVEPNGKDLATCVWGEYDIGAGLVGSGWGIANRNETDIYVPYEVKAQSESSGLWQGTFYAPEDWRDIKRRKNDFTIKRTRVSRGGGGFFDFGSWF